MKQKHINAATCIVANLFAYCHNKSFKGKNFTWKDFPEIASRRVVVSIFMHFKANESFDRIYYNPYTTEKFCDINDKNRLFISSERCYITFNETIAINAIFSK